MKKKFISLFVLIIIGFIIGLVVNANVSAKNKKEDIIKEDTIKKKEQKENTQVESKKIKVDIKGSIAAPGVYEILENSRVIDVINLAGGLLESAETKAINLSKIIKDEDVIIIYEKNNEIKDEQDYEEIINMCNKDNNDACISEDSNDNTSDNTIININTATKEELMTLTGVGESKAIKIIEYRNTNGNFIKKEDIMNVAGIGDSIFEKIKERITV